MVRLMERFDNMRQKNGMLKQSGAVSLFIVILTAVLLTGVTVTFTTLMLSDQERSTDNNLAQSAKDSAEAGVEDAKRLLAELADCREKGLVGHGPASAERTRCNNISKAINDRNCDTISKAINPTSSEKERKVAQSANDNKLDQAYTCVIINPDTEAFIGKTEDVNGIQVIPLKGNGKFDEIELSWLDRKDVSNTVKTVGPGTNGHFSLPQSKTAWGKQGAVIRVGVIPYSQAGNVRDMDENSRTAFLYSGANIAGNSSNINLAGNDIDIHKPIYNDSNEGVPADAINKINPIRCEGLADQNGEHEPVKSEGYLCKTRIRVKSDINSDKEVQLTLASLYRSTSFSISLKDSTDPSKRILFEGVQPEIDSTGRANNVFQRVVSRVEAIGGGAATFPRAAVGSSGHICKDFAVTDEPNGYSGSSEPGCPNLVD